ncbi:hypothetical protein JW824_09730 [bacterium]|nr:hypothetical protein [bacterium]
MISTKIVRSIPYKKATTLPYLSLKPDSVTILKRIQYKVQDDDRVDGYVIYKMAFI